jgi:flagellar FliJ protein
MFAFNLQPVLNYRKTIEEKKLAEFAGMQRKLEGEKKLLEGIVKEKLLIVEQLKEMQQDTFRAADLSFSLSYIGILKEKEAVQQKVTTKIAEEVERLRKELIETVKDRKILDILKEHKITEFNLEVASIERKAIEETAIQAFARRKK